MKFVGYVHCLLAIINLLLLYRMSTIPKALVRKKDVIAS
jgi:hypothetical protein